MVGDSLEMSCRFYPPIEENLPTLMDIRPFLSLNQYCGAGSSISYYSSLDEYSINLRSTWEKLKKAEDGKSLTYKFRCWVKPGYTYFVRMGARVNDTYQNYNYTDIIKVEVPDGSSN